MAYYQLWYECVDCGKVFSKMSYEKTQAKCDACGSTNVFSAVPDLEKLFGVESEGLK